MAILHARDVRSKPRPANETRRASDLTPEEQANVRAAIRWLAKRHGGVRKLAALLGVSYPTANRACLKGGRPSAALAIRAARVAGASVEAVLGGTWPPPGACPHCGRT